jgi:hypothetical protein
LDKNKIKKTDPIYINLLNAIENNDDFKNSIMQLYKVTAFQKPLLYFFIISSMILTGMYFIKTLNWLKKTTIILTSLSACLYILNLLLIQNKKKAITDTINTEFSQLQKSKKGKA